jgi:hypothetical protein
MTKIASHSRKKFPGDFLLTVFLRFRGTMAARRFGRAATATTAFPVASETTPEVPDRPEYEQNDHSVFKHSKPSAGGKT